jgi:hypothetical protein
MLRDIPLLDYTPDFSERSASSLKPRQANPSETVFTADYSVILARKHNM